jgi:uncharacterized membrane protein YeaQ/YmgE (transglycosylase-associated protein family)
MGLIVFLIIALFIGLFVGALARLLLPGPDPMGLGTTALIGIAGSFIAAIFSWYVLHRHGAGVAVSPVERWWRAPWWRCAALVADGPGGSRSNGTGSSAIDGLLSMLG